MTLFAIAAWLVAGTCVAIVGLGFYAIASDRMADHPQAYGVCTPNRGRMLTGANQEHMIRVRASQIDALERRCEELEDQLEIVPLTDEHARQDAEIERLQAVIRQRNRTIKHLRSALGQQQASEQPQPAVTVGKADRFEWLEIRRETNAANE